MKVKYVLFVLLVFGTLSCSSSKSKESPAALTDQMKTMGKDVRNLLPYLYNREAFHSPKNKATIAANLKRFSEHAHKIAPNNQALSDDPLVSFSLQNLEADLKRASQAFEMNHVEYARMVTRSSFNNCFRCHSTAPSGAAPAWELGDYTKLELGPVEKSDLLVATRKSDEALRFMEGQIGSKDFLQNYPFEYEALLRRYLALIIRVEKAPARALAEMDRVSANDLPQYIGEQVQGWKVSLTRWVRELKAPPKKQPPPIKQAEAYMAQASKLQQFSQDHAGDVELLRATALLHDYLKNKLKPEEAMHARYLLGRAYEVLDELGSWNLHEIYYEDCVRKLPKSSFAKLCYARFEASVIQGYSGSSGTHIPPYEKEKLKTLKELL